ncbi:DUF5320 domain-containing protein [Aceticella autotrophica]|uniref:DUF5320 domain-containing protein n=1 Tax=Aceticella autotrophica TaxID=2755338 RepID=A0A975AV29_9THEO|nr:DUF5320 domain-containing protein [Aceticella autotrophica]QSZ26989.1 DUF5320 domain-containing protein [Aceticella autotrophica]
MPRGNGTGPMGMGPRTGRGMGYCSGYNVPGYANRAGFGMRRGYRNMYYATGIPGWGRAAYAANDEDALNAEAQYLKEQLDLINKRLDEIEKKNNNEK